MPDFCWLTPSKHYRSYTWHMQEWIGLYHEKGSRAKLSPLQWRVVMQGKVPIHPRNFHHHSLSTDQHHSSFPFPIKTRYNCYDAVASVLLCQKLKVKSLLLREIYFGFRLCLVLVLVRIKKIERREETYILRLVSRILIHFSNG